MTTIRVVRDVLQVGFPGWERWFVGRAGVTVPLASISSVEVLPDWSSEILGWRSGLAISGLLKLGWFTHPSGRRRLVAMRRGRPLLRIGLRDHDVDALDVDELLVSDIDAAATADQIVARSLT